MKNLRIPTHGISTSEEITRFDKTTEVINDHNQRFVVVDDAKYFFATDLAHEIGYKRIDNRANCLFKHTYRLGKYMLLSREQVVYLCLSHGRSDIALRFVQHLNFDYEALSKASFIANVMRGLGIQCQVLAIKNEKAYPMRIETLFIGHNDETDNFTPWQEEENLHDVYFDFEQPLEELFQYLLLYLKTRYKSL